MFVNADAAPIQVVNAPRIVFEGRNRLETKRQMLRFWERNQDRLQMGLHEFLRRCTLMEDERTVVFQPSLRRSI